MKILGEQIKDASCIAFEHVYNCSFFSSSLNDSCSGNPPWPMHVEQVPKNVRWEYPCSPIV